MELSPFQNKALLVPEGFDLFLGGGRGGSKSHTLALLAMRHAEQYGRKAHILYLRQTYQGLADFESVTRLIFGELYGRRAKYNGASHIWRLPSGASMELGQLEGEGDYSKYQGRNFTLLMIDEAGQYATPPILDRLRSNLRGPADLPLRVVMAANPGDVGHQWLAARYVFRAAPWVPFLEPNSGRHWVNAPSTFLDNPFIDQQAYKRQLEASAPADPELLRAWLHGDWAIARGAYFGAVLSESRNSLASEPSQYVTRSPRTAELWLAHDYGSTAPSVTYVVLRSAGFTGPDGHYFPNGSLLLLDELATHPPENLNQGLGWTIPRLAEEIRSMCKTYRMKPHGVADDAIFAEHGHRDGSIAAEFGRCQVRFRPAKKAERRPGWEIMRRLLQDAGKPDKPGLYIHRQCSYFWQTVPYLARDPKRIEDVDSRGPDHAADAARYACLYHRQVIRAQSIEDFLSQNGASR
jgi:hypothetical protein